MATYTFEKWYLYGSGWTTSYWGQATISVSRAYGSDYATVTASNVKMYTYGGDSSATWTFWIKIAGNWYSWQLSKGGHTAGVTYNYGSKTWSISVGANAGSLNIVTEMDAYDYNNNIHGYSAQMPSSSGDNYSYGSKGASTISSASNVTLNTSGTATSTVSFTSYSSSFTHKVWATIGSTSTTVYTVNGANNSSLSKAITFGTAFINAINTAKTGTATVHLTTWSGSTQIGSESTKTITLTVPSGINPTVAINSVTKTANVANSFANKCTLLDKVTVSWGFTQSYGSALNSGTVTVDGKSGSNTSLSYVSDVMSNYGSLSASVSATDKRGNTGTASTTFEVYYYFYPTVTVKYGKDTDYYLDLGGRIAYVGGENTGQLRLAIYKGSTQIASNLDLDEYIASSASGGTYDGYYEISGTYTIPHDDGGTDYIPDIDTETYTFTLTVSDSVTSRSASAYSGIAVMTFGAGGTDVTVHKPTTFEQEVNVPSDSPYMVATQTVSVSGSSSTSIQATGISEYEFFCWVGVASVGFIGTPYIENSGVASTKVWDANYSTTTSYFYRLTAIYRKV